MRFPIGLSASMAVHLAKKRLANEQFIPLVLMLEPLFACNLTCSTCGRIREYKDYTNKMMSVEECLAAARECEAPIVSVCGGEPLIYPYIGELVSKLVAMKRHVYLCTNGIMLAKSLDRFRPSRRLQLNIHIDGPKDIHDMVVEKPGAYDAAIAGIRLAIRKGFQVTVNTTICKQTDMEKVDSHMNKLSRIGVSHFMLSPAYSYDSVDDKECFMSKEDVHEKFKNIDQIAQRHRLADTPIYLEYLKGERDLECTAWGSPTRNVVGWRSPCYLVADQHFPTFKELIENTAWDTYGVGKDPRCKDCMVHCGFEPTAALMVNKHKGDIWKMLKWNIK